MLSFFFFNSFFVFYFFIYILLLLAGKHYVRTVLSLKTTEYVLFSIYSSTLSIVEEDFLNLRTIFSVFYLTFLTSIFFPINSILTSFYLEVWSLHYILPTDYLFFFSSFDLFEEENELFHSFDF